MSIKEYDRKLAELNGEIRALFDFIENLSKEYQKKINEREKLITSQIPF